MKKKLTLLIGLVFLMSILAGCTEINEPITSESEGFWNSYIVYPLSWLIIKVAELVGDNFGISIIIVTILVRILILPLMIKQIRSSKAMQAIQPELQELQKKYSSKDQKTQQKLQQETMELFQRHKVNPLAGCLPIFIQMPILIGFYHAISRTYEIKNHTFLWTELGTPDPLFILPVVAAVLTFIQTKVTMKGQANTNEMMKTQMAIMQWMMPAMILFLGATFPAALSLYWVVGTLFSIIQTLVIKGPEIKTDKEVVQVRDTDKSGGKKK